MSSEKGTVFSECIIKDPRTKCHYNQWRLRQVNRFLDISFYITLHENYVTHEIFTFRAR